MSDIARLDKNMAAAEVKDDIAWYDLRELGVEGRGWSETERYYSRLPKKAKGVVREPVWDLAQHSAGLCARFVTDATSISGRWTLLNQGLAMDHMPATGMSGLDLYVRLPGSWRWIGVGRPTQWPTNHYPLNASLRPGLRQYMIYLPLYNGVEQVQIGLPVGARLSPAAPWPESKRKPIVFYGTSIVQGGCASRPGMVHTAILGRRLDWPTINLGFSGNGQMEEEMADLLAELDPAAYVLDALPNVQEPQVTQRLEPMVYKLRRAHPQTPILLVESITYQDGYLNESRYQRYTTSNAAQRAALRRLREADVANLHVVAGEKLLGDDGEGTVDGTHATDLGFTRLADAIEPVLRRALG